MRARRFAVGSKADHIDELRERRNHGLIEPEARDANEAEIVRALVQIPGVEVWRLPNRMGLADLLVWRARHGWCVLEVKTDTGRVSPGQVLRDHSGMALIVRTVDDALRAISIVGGSAAGEEGKA